MALEAWAVGVTALHFACGSSSRVISNTFSDAQNTQDNTLANFCTELKETGVPWVLAHARFIGGPLVISNEAGVFDFIAKLLDLEPKGRCIALNTFLQ